MSANKPETIKKLRKELRKFVAQTKSQTSVWYQRAAMYCYSREDGRTKGVNYYCHGHVTNGKGISGLVEHLKSYVDRHETVFPGFREAFKAYVGYILNRHPLSSVALDKSAYRAIRYGLPVDVTKTNFEVRAFLMSLRRGKELPAACIVWKKLVDAGIDENVAFIIISTYEFSGILSGNGGFSLSTYYFSGSSDHSLLCSYGDWRETFNFFKKPYAASKNTKKFNSSTHISYIKKRVAKTAAFQANSLYGLALSVGGLRCQVLDGIWEAFLEVAKKIDTKFKELS